MQQYFQNFLILIASLLLFLVSCDTNDPFVFTPPDFSTVPSAYDISNLPSQEIESGVEIIVHEEGIGAFQATTRDELSVFITLRTENGDIIYSSFANGTENPSVLTMRTAGRIQPITDFNRQYSIPLAYSPGLKAGLLGMRESEQRTIIVSPEKGFQNAPSGLYVYNFRDDTLIYDVRVSRIFPG